MNTDSQSERVIKILTLLEEATKGMPETMSALISKEYNKDPFLILISCLLSLRALDKVTYPIARQLFKVARTPQEIIPFPLHELEELLHPIGFYRRKAHIIKEVSKELIERFDGKVPHTEEELLSIKGVGLKTAALVLSEAFGIPAICVDTHVHRVCNRLDIVETKNPEQTQRALKEIVPQEWWIKVNRLFVMWGQNICVPLSPFCTKCILSPWCPRRGVKKFR